MNNEMLSGFAILIICIVALVALLVVLALVILIIKIRKPREIIIDEEFLNFVITNYGGKENIKNVEVENSRLKITVEDLDLVNLDELKTKAESGIFVTGNTIKTLYKLSSDKIKIALEGRLK
jgi:phosphotransferase system IIB component